MSTGKANAGRSSEVGDKWADKRIFTTGEAAEVCKVSQQTIIRCFDAGRLVGFRVPGSRFRRIPREELIRFMKANDIPLDVLEGPKKRVLVVDDDPQILEVFRASIGRDARFELHTADNGYEAGMLTESVKPHLIVLDYMLPDINGNVVCERLRANPAHSATHIIFVSGVVEEAEVEKLLESGASEFVKKPFEVRALIERMAELLEV